MLSPPQTGLWLFEEPRQRTRFLQRLPPLHGSELVGSAKVGNVKEVLVPIPLIWRPAICSKASFSSAIQSEGRNLYRATGAVAVKGAPMRLLAKARGSKLADAEADVEDLT